MNGNRAARTPAAARATTTGPRRLGCVGAWVFVLLVALTPDAGAVVAINGPWVRVAPSGTSAEAYMEIQSSTPASLIDVRSAAAAKVTLRSPGKRAATIAEVPLPAGALVALAPDGFRIGLERLARPLKLGDYVALIVTIRGDDGNVLQLPLSAEVRKRSARDDHRHAHAH